MRNIWRVIKKYLINLVFILCLLLPVFLVALVHVPQVQLVTFYLVGWSYKYSEAGSCILSAPNGTFRLSIYKAPGKPFLIVGPYCFSEDVHDFFFVAKDRVLRSVTDKGGEWFAIGNMLFLDDDMSGIFDPVRMPYWYDIHQDERDKILFFPSSGEYMFQFKINDSDKFPARLFIPKKFFTADMPEFRGY